eukprot:scaffold130654_cov31-Tisochrysis_lutea.AAC.4
MPSFHGIRISGADAPGTPWQACAPQMAPCSKIGDPTPLPRPAEVGCGGAPSTAIDKARRGRLGADATIACRWERSYIVTDARDKFGRDQAVCPPNSVRSRRPSCCTSRPWLSERSAWNCSTLPACGLLIGDEMVGSTWFGGTIIVNCLPLRRKAESGLGGAWTVDSMGSRRTLPTKSPGVLFWSSPSPVKRSVKADEPPVTADGGNECE